MFRRGFFDYNVLLCSNFVSLLKMIKMSLALTNNMIDKYFGFLTKLDNVSKKKLIAKLAESI